MGNTRPTRVAAAGSLCSPNILFALLACRPRTISAEGRQPNAEETEATRITKRSSRWTARMAKMVSSRGSSLSSRDQTQKARSNRLGVLACRSSFPSAMQAMPLAAIPLTALIPPRVGNRRNHIPKTLESPLIFLHSRGLPTLSVVAASALGWGSAAV